jgi:7-carboxy-7-deazaguanine synthase
VFIRLGGCNLACTFCDTEFESFSRMTLDEVLEQVARAAITPMPPLIVITGGEPLRQPLCALTDALLGRGHDVQIETNGTLFQELDERVHIVCSPKAVAGRYSLLRPDVLARVDALKFLISADTSPYDAVPDVGECHAPVYVQPMDAYDAARNAANVAHTLHLVQTKGYRLSLQLHKILAIP